MNIYKMQLMLEEFPFLDEILRKREDYFVRSEDQEWRTERYGKRLGFRIEEEPDGFSRISYLEIPDGIVIKRGDKNLLSKTPSFDFYSWCDGGHHDHESYFAVAGDTITQLDESGSSRTGSGDNTEVSAPTIGEQLLLKKLDPDFIVSYEFQDSDDNGDGEPCLLITIYKMKKFNLAEYHCRQIDKAAAELKAEITVVCKG